MTNYGNTLPSTDPDIYEVEHYFDYLPEVDTATHKPSCMPASGKWNGGWDNIVKILEQR